MSTKRISFYISDKQWTDLKIMCVLTHRTMSDFVRVAIQDKVIQIKGRHIMESASQKLPSDDVLSHTYKT